MKPYKDQTYYELLELEPTATAEEIRAAYERAVRYYDADNVALYPLGDTSQLEELKKLQLEAMEILTDPELRVEYDRSLGLPAAPPPSPKEIDQRADEARQVGDEQHVEEVAEPAPPATEVEFRPLAPVLSGPEPVVEAAPASQPEPVTEPPPRTEEPAAPAQLEMQEVVERAESVHSTAPRFTVSYIPHVPPPPKGAEVLEVKDAPVPKAGAAASSGPVAPGTAATSGAPAEAPTAAPAAAVPPAPAPPAPAASPPPREWEKAQHIAQEEAIATAESAMAEVSALARRAREPRAAPPPQAAPPAAAPRPKVEIPADAEFGGELLRQVREGRGYSIQQLADRTRISVRHLENVEADRYDQLPATVYLRGILMNIGRELGLDALRVARSYLALVDKSGVKPK